MTKTNKKVTLAVTNDVSHDRRVEKMCNTLNDLGWEATVVGRKLKKSAKIDKPFKVKRLQLFFTKGVLFYAEYNLRLFFYLLFTKTDVIHANDLDTLLACYLASKVKGTKLVYDSHEYFTEVPEIQDKPLVKKVWLGIEKWIFPKLENVITVNNSIANAYKKKYSVNVRVVRNVPLKVDLPTNVIAKDFGGKFTILMQGAGINVDRGAEELIEATDFLPDDFLVLIIGSGDVWGQLKALIHEKQIRKEKVKLIDRLPYKVLLAYTKGANIGVSLDKPTNLNYTFSLPNKLFDYCMAGLPVVGSNVVEVAGIIEKHNIGWVVNSVDAKTLADCFISIKNNHVDFLLKKENAEKLHLLYNWEKEVEPIIQIYAKL